MPRGSISARGRPPPTPDILVTDNDNGDPVGGNVRRLSSFTSPSLFSSYKCLARTDRAVGVEDLSGWKWPRRRESRFFSPFFPNKLLGSAHLPSSFLQKTDGVSALQEAPQGSHSSRSSMPRFSLLFSLRIFLQIVATTLTRNVQNSWLETVRAAPHSPLRRDFSSALGMTVSSSSFSEINPTKKKISLSPRRLETRAE